MKKQLLVVIFTIISIYSYGQNTPQILLDKFFSDYDKKGAKVAVEEIYKTNSWMSRKPDAINNLKNEFAKFDKELVGNYYGYVFIDKIETSQCYSIYTYFMKFDRQPLRLTFEFYKPDKEWRIQGFKFDDSYDDDFEKALIWKYSSK